jgi:hypothetical protein
MIRTTKSGKAIHKITFPQMPLAHTLLDGKVGLEIGAAAHNTRGLIFTLSC